MINRDIALHFVTSFCDGDLDALSDCLASDFQLKGPLYEFDSRLAYLESLRCDPPDQCDFLILNITEGTDSVCVFYQCEKRDGPLTIAQWFGLRDGKIAESMLVFDPRRFASS